jgi:ring-1,2-phenylacetyl-CoA epoxidase subunit PaaE
MQQEIKKYTLVVSEKQIETSDCVTLKFKQPGLKKIKYLPGQYITVIINIHGRKYKRSYSISSIFGTGNTIDITVKTIPCGIVSNYFKDHISVGDVIEVYEPMGHFLLPEKPGKEIFLWGAGSGITPLYAILQHGLMQDDSTRYVLVYSVKDVANCIFYEQLKELQKKYPLRLTILFFATLSTLGFDFPLIYSGRLREETTDEILTASYDISQTIHFLCGPDSYKDVIVKCLLQLGVDSSRILYETFYSKASTGDLQEVVEAQMDIEIAGNQSNVNISLGKSILEAALDANCDVEYSCQTGDCALCVATLLEGEVKIAGNIKPNIQLGANEYLLCCSFPKTLFIKIKV